MHACSVAQSCLTLLWSTYLLGICELSPWILIVVLLLFLLSVHFTLVTQSCPTLCDPMNLSTPGLPVHHHLPEFTQTHIHRVGDAIQPSHPLSSPFPSAPNPSQHQSLLQWVSHGMLLYFLRSLSSYTNFWDLSLAMNNSMQLPALGSHILFSSRGLLLSRVSISQSPIFPFHFLKS